MIKNILFQTKLEVKGTFRSKQTLFFTFGFPLMFLLIFGTLNRNSKIDSLGNLPFINFYVPGIIAYGILLGAINNLAITISQLKISGIFKRIRTTPLPWPAYVGGIILSTIFITLLSSFVLFFVGVVLYDAQLPGNLLPALLFFVVGSFCFVLLGIACATLVPNPDKGAGVLVIITLPVMFISDVFYPLQGVPAWLTTLADVLPLKPLVEGLSIPFRNNLDIQWTGLLVLIIWGIIGAWFARRYFKNVSNKK